MLENTSFRTAAGSSVAFVGHTGGGESAVVPLLARFYNANTGTILLDGEPIKSLNISRYRSCIGLVNQGPALPQSWNDQRSLRMNLLTEYNGGDGIPDSKPGRSLQTSERIRFYTFIVIRICHNPEITYKHINLNLDDSQLWRPAERPATAAAGAGSGASQEPGNPRPRRGRTPIPA